MEILDLNEDERVNHANGLQRLLASCIDSALVTFISISIISTDAFGYMIINFTMVYTFFCEYFMVSVTSILIIMNERISEDGIYGLLIILISWLYESLMLSSSKQATVGQMLMNIHVTGLNNETISFGKATKRHFSRIISWTIFLIGYIMFFLGNKKQTMHDILTNTLVVKNKQIAQ